MFTRINASSENDRSFVLNYFITINLFRNGVVTNYLNDLFGFKWVD
jgi:hypothetical protein